MTDCSSGEGPDMSEERKKKRKKRKGFEEIVIFPH